MLTGRYHSWQNGTATTVRTKVRYNCKHSRWQLGLLTPNTPEHFLAFRVFIYVCFGSTYFKHLWSRILIRSQQGFNWEAKKLLILHIKDKPYLGYQTINLDLKLYFHVNFTQLFPKIYNVLLLLTKSHQKLLLHNNAFQIKYSIKNLSCYLCEPQVFWLTWPLRCLKI